MWRRAFLSILALGLVGLGVALPSAPAFIGPIHTAMIYSLNSIYGLPKDDAAAFAIITHLLMIAPVTVAGLICMAHEGMSLGQLRRRAKHIEEDAESPAVIVTTE